MSILFKLLLVMVPTVIGMRKAYSDFTIANKRTSAKKKAALKSSRRTAITGGAFSIVLAAGLFIFEGRDNDRKERTSTERHQDIRTNQLTGEQIAEVVRKELKSNAQQQIGVRKAEFQQKYPNGFAFFSVAESFVSEEFQHWPPGFFQTDWSTASVKRLTETEVGFVLPDMWLAGSRHHRSVVGIPRKTGATSNFALINLGTDVVRNLSTNLYLVVEVAANSPFGVTMVLGSKVVLEPVQ